MGINLDNRTIDQTTNDNIEMEQKFTLFYFYGWLWYITDGVMLTTIPLRKINGTFIDPRTKI